MAKAAYSPGLEDVLAGESSICLLDGKKGTLSYRGYDIKDLAEHSSYGEVVYLLLHKKLPSKIELQEFVHVLKSNRQIPKDLLGLYSTCPGGIHPMDMLKSGVSFSALYDPDLDDISAEANIRKATRIIAKIPTIIASTYRFCKGMPAVQPDPDLDHAANFLYMLKGEKPDDYAANVFDKAMLLYAEHEYNASTFAARVTASTLSDIHSAIVAAVGALKGPLHGGANERAMKMLLDIKTPENAEKYIKDALANKQKIMGFGHRVYKTYDPRAKILKEYVKEMSSKQNNFTWLQIGEKVEQVLLKEKNIYPNVDFYTSILYYQLGIPILLYTPIFAAARAAGWSAHILEQLEDNKLIRPRAIYSGAKNLKYAPVNQRK